MFAELLLNVTYTGIYQSIRLLHEWDSNPKGDIQQHRIPCHIACQLASAPSTQRRLKNSLIRLALAVKLAMVIMFVTSDTLRESERALGY